MGPLCTQCGVATVHDSDVGYVCPACGNILDPGRVVLAADDGPPTLADTLLSGGLKNARGRYIAGADQEARTRKNMLEMHRFIKNLSRAALVSGLSDRACNLFEQAMGTGHYRWGRTAKLVAGACISIALRLSSRPELFVELSQLLGEKTTALTSTFSSVISALKMDPLPSSEPKSHLQTLQEHLHAALDSADSGLPSALISTLKPLPSNAVSATAMALSDLLVSSTTPSAVAHLPTAPTACAVLLWAIEAELRTSLAQVGELAALLARKYNASKPVVMNRYKTIQDELIARIDKVDWLDHYEPNSGKAGRAKIPRRTVAARGLKAIIELERETRREEFSGDTREGDNDDLDGVGDTDRPRKRRRPHALRDATRFLCNPLVGPIPACLVGPPSDDSPLLPLPTYLLTSPILMRRDNLPTRLQLLAASRGGVGSDEIREDELFDDDELDKIFRPEEEAEGDLRKFYGWEPKAERLAALDAFEPPRKLKRTDGQPRKSSRINAESVARFMADDKPEDGMDLDDLILFEEDQRLIIEENGDFTNTFMGLSRSMLAEDVYIDDVYTHDVP